MKKGKVFQRFLASLLSLALVLTGISLQGLTPVQAAEPEDSLIVYYDFVSQNSEAAQIPDASKHGNIAEIDAVDGSARGKYTIVDANIYGKEVKALDMKGGEDGAFLLLPEGILSECDAATISVWVKLTTDNGYQRIWDFGSGTGTNFYLCSDNYNEGREGYSAIIANGNGEVGIGKGKDGNNIKNIDKNRWVLTTVVMNGTNMSLYENGELIGTKDTGISLKDLGETTNNYIAYSNWGDTPTTGQFAEFKIYNKALTAQEIAAMYDVTDAGIVSADDAELDLGDLSHVTEDFQLPAKGVNGSDLTWTSQNDNITIENGTAKVTRPAKGTPDVSGTITADISYKTAGPAKKTFDVTVMAQYTDQQVVAHDKEAAQNAVGDISTIIDKRITLPAKGEWGSTITWTWEGQAGAKGNITIPTQADEDGNVTAEVTRPPIGSANETGKLKAVIASGLVTADLTFDVRLLAYSESITITSVEPISVTTPVGHSPSLPNYAKVNYSNNTTGKIQVRWPDDIDPESYKAAGTFTVTGTLVGEYEEATATVTVVDQAEAEKALISGSFDLRDISLDKIGENGSILTQNRDRDIAYLKLLDNNRMLYNFYNTFGETDKIAGVTPPDGWEKPGELLRGHSTGHYMSALALAYASTGDAEIKTKLDSMVSELHRLQQKSKGNPADFKISGSTMQDSLAEDTWSKDPDTWGEGFISGYSPDQFALLEVYAPYGSPGNGIWAPYYTLHKLLAGLIDAYTYTGNTEALVTAKALGKWTYNRLSVLPQEQLTKMWDMYIAGEFGGFNESMAQLYIYAKAQGDADADVFLNGAKLFDNTTFFDNLAKNVDDIRNRHANQHIPQIIGALKVYEATAQAGKADMYYYDVAENFWQMTVSRYAYSIGGVGVGEAFPKEPYTQAANIMGDRNCETCAAYNMMKLTKMLNNYDPDNAEYMDYYERTLYNQILASQTPNVTDNMHNGTTYMLPIGPGAKRLFGGDYDSFTCCHGTGMENHVKYQEAAYAKTANDLYVGLYLPSTLTWTDKGVKVVQETTFPSDTTKLTVSALAGQTAKTFNMKLRVPYWASKGFVVKVNGTTKMESAPISTYVTLENIKAGDVVEITMPWSLHLDKTPDTLESATVASIMYGPLVMAAPNNIEEWQSLRLPEKLENYLTISTDEETGLPILTGGGYTFMPMFAKELATARYHAYFKVAVMPDDGSEWYHVDVTNRTPNNGSIRTNAKGTMIRENTDLVITLKPNEGYAVRKLIVNGEEVQAKVKDNVYTLKNVAGDVEVSATFRPPVDDPMHLEYSADISSDRENDQDNWYGEKEDVQRDWEPESSYGHAKGWVNWWTPAGEKCELRYTWDEPVTMNAFEIYWRVNRTDDMKGSWMQTPGSLSISYLDANGNWQKANMISKYEDVVKTNQYNTIFFDEITTTAVRLDMTINTRTVGEEGAGCTGVYRWKVSEYKSALTSVVTKAQDMKEADYTPETWAALQKALADAKAVGENATKEEVYNAAAALDIAMSKLVKFDKTKLEEAIASAGQKNQADYTADSWKKLQDALKKAQDVYKAPRSQDEIDEAAKNLNTAIDGLVKVTSVVSNKPATPTSVKASWTGKKTVKITWKAAKDAKKYEVYRSYSKKGKYTKVGTVTKTTYTDKKATPGKTAYYKVMAYNGTEKSSYSSVSNTYILKAPAKVKKSIKGKGSKKNVTISFGKVAKASGYEIYKSTKKKGKYKKAATLTSGKTVKKTFKKMKKGTYYYKVRAYKKNGKKKIYTDYSKVLTVKVK